ncbi:MAG: cysteine desulfurase NifS [Eubacterium sp.]|nr:cysteine desulfurase NifS [Eubacterium sp.]
MERFIYLDNAATTKVLPEVFEAMKPYFEEQYGNPSSSYTFSGRIAGKVEEARDSIAKFLGAKREEIYFTSGGSESDNWALKGIADAFREKGKHIITTKIEHHAILHTAEYLEKHGYEVTYLDVDENGFVNPEDLEKAIRPDTILVSIMFANNEIGTVEPIKELGRIAHQHGVLFHTDAVQAFGHLPIDVNEMNIDMLSASSHKINGPKGVGIFYLRRNTNIESFIHGGAQERGRRAGTTNAAGIIGTAKAVEIAAKKMEQRIIYERELRDYLIERVLKEIPYTRLNGDRELRLSNNANFCFRFIEGESLMILLDLSGIEASSGSACTSGALDPSHVLLALGLPKDIARGSIRLTLSEETTKDDIDYTVEVLKKSVERLRSMSPFYADFIKNQN